MNRLKKYSFKLLKDEAYDKDAFEDQTHEKIAESIFNLIKNEDKGISIGLEGQWGSGKTLIISILHKKLQKDNNLTPLISFDAWAHEGDHLRRIFLESLIKKLQTDKEIPKLKELGEKISNRKKIINITTKQSTTSFGLWLTISLFLLPIGVSFLSKVEFSKISFNGSPYWLFISGFILSVNWLIVLIGNFFYWFVKEKGKLKNIFKLKNWAFLQKNATQDITQEVSEEEERSSIEFERYFEEIIQITFNDLKKEKLVLVIDNLDRVDARDSLKIWSTLQTFLQQRNQPGNKKSWFDKIWIIVPYDPSGLKALWENNLHNNEQHNNQQKSKSFFDKCFQLRIDVPKPIFSGWEKFTNDMMKDSLINWEQEDKDELIRILRMTRKSLDDIPTPREIKNYINQVGFLVSQWQNMFPISSIAYFVCWRELEHTDVNDIRKELVNKNLINISHLSLLPDSCIKDLAGLVFGVSPEKGEQLLLGVAISKSILEENEKILIDLSEKHNRGFWSVFYYHFDHSTMELDYVLKVAKVIYKSIWDKHHNKCIYLIKKIINVNFPIKSDKIKWPENEIENYFCLMEICRSNKNFIKKTYNYLLTCLKATLKSEENIKWSDVLINLSKIVKKVINIDQSISKEIIDELKLKNLIPWSMASNSENLDLYKWFSPPKTITDEIANEIKTDQPLIEGLLGTIEYTINTGIINGWDTVLNKSQEYINQNNGNYSNQSDDIFKIVNMLAFKMNNLLESVKKIILSGQYNNLFWHRRTQNIIEVPLLSGFILKTELHSITIPEMGNSQNGFTEIKNFWININTDYAKKIIEEIKKYKLWTFLWELGKDSQNQLVGEIITLAFDDPDATDFFNIKDGLSKISYYITLIPDDDKSDEKVHTLVKKLINHSPLEQEIIEKDDLDIIKYSYELYIIADTTNKEQVIDKLSKDLNSVSKETWEKAFIDDYYLIFLALKVKEKKAEFYLKNDYLEAIIDFAKDINVDSIKLSDWQKEHWTNFISLMNSSFQKHYKSKITEYLCKQKLAVSPEFFNLNEKYFLNAEILEETKIMQDCLEKFIKDKDYERLSWLNIILFKAKRKKFKPDKNFSDVISKPFNDLYREQKDEQENKAIIKQLAEKFNVNLVQKVTLTDDKKDELITKKDKS